MNRAVQRLGARVFEFWWGRGIADDVPALAYYLLLSIGPLALGVASVHALLLEDIVSALQVATQINRFLPEAVHPDIQNLILNTRANSPWLLALAIVAMLWTSSGAIGVVERCESRILDCPRHDVVTGRLRNIVLGALVGLSFIVSSGSAPVIGEAAALFNLRGALPGGLVFTLNAVGSVVLFAVIYRYAPRSPIGWKPAFLGALPSGAAIQAVPWLVGLYFGAAAGFAAVRLFLLLAVLLLGLYTMAAVMLVGAGLAATGENRARRRDGRIRRLPGSPEALIHHREQAGRAPGRAGAVAHPELGASGTPDRGEPCQRPMRFTLRLPHEPGSIPVARRELQRLHGSVDDLTLRNTRLLVSELVTNAVRHVPAGEGDEIELVVDRPEGHVRVEVADSGPGFDPAPRAEATPGSSGWGLHIMDRLATRWGVDADRGSRVWFELETPVRSAAGRSAALAMEA